MHSEAHELKAFLDALAKDPRDTTTRAVFADWLDDHDEPGLADEQRMFSLEKYDAEMYLRWFAAKYANDDYQGMISGVMEGEYCFSDDSGPCEARDNVRFWEAIEIITKQEFDQERQGNVSFRCSC